MMRASGILLPVFSLPSKYGIGGFSESAYEFVDLLQETGQSCWQILPLGPTGYGDSPYQSFSTFAGNPYFINLEELIQEGWLKEEECAAWEVGQREDWIDYEKIYQSRFPLLRQAFIRSQIQKDKEYQEFWEENKEWLSDYCLYMGVKENHGGISWEWWEEDIRTRKPEAVEKYREICKEEMEFQGFVQYLFAKQWRNLKNYANDKGIRIIGDIPIYVAFDSADTWANPHLFQFDENQKPVAVAGCPPDAFAPTGQLWGNPLYDWEVHRETGYEWWIKRMEHCFRLYDIVRVDHFRGFDAYYSIPYGHNTAECGSWKKGPGLEFFQVLKEMLGNVEIIAEDLGYLTESVKALVKDTGYPGMKVLEFAFDSREESDYLPHNYEKNCVVYTGTHDNQTLVSWYGELTPEDRKLAVEYLDLEDRGKSEINWVFVRAALASVAELAVIPIQDYLGLGKEARINTPSTLGKNWCWRLKQGEITGEIAEKIRKLCKLYGRENSCDSCKKK